VDTKFLLRKSTGDQPIASEAELRDALQRGQCKPADFLFDFAAGKWGRAGDHPALAPLFAEKPAGVPDRRVIYFFAPGAAPGSPPQGPYSTKEIQSRAQQRELCASTWVFVEGDKEWRQIKNVKILHDMLPPLPVDQPEAVAPAPAAAPAMAAAPIAPPAAPPSAPPLAPPAAAPAMNPGEEPPAFSLGLDSSAPPSAPAALSLSLGGGGAAPVAAPVNATPLPASAAPPEQEIPSNPSIKLDLGSGPTGVSAIDGNSPPGAPGGGGDLDDPHIEREEVTMALDVMGLKLHSEHATPAAPPPKPPKPGIAPVPGSAPPAPPKLPGAPGMAATLPPIAPPSPAGASGSGLSLGTPPGGTPRPPAAPPKPKEDFDGIVAEIPTDPIWLVKQASGETVSGPFRFLEVVKFLEEGKLTKNDKIARTGTKAFTKIGQQYEFNVKFSIESVVENGQEKQKILIRRRHPRVPYITGVQIVSKHGLLAGQCVNISAGGILMEAPKAEFNLGEIIEVKIMPGLIAKSITCKSLIIGKIPKIPPGYALKFEDLKNEDKEAIEFYVTETLKREMSKKN
jgi:hypothetical protein